MGQQPRALSPHLSLDHFIGSEIRTRRTQRRLSHRELAALVHVSADLIARIERGERRIAADLAAACDTVLQSGGALRQLVEARPERPSPAIARSDSLDPIEALSALIAGGADEHAEGIFARATERMATYPEHAPAALWTSTQQDLRLAQELLRAIPSLRSHRTLLRSVAVLTGTSGHLLMDLADRANAHRYLTLSRQAGEQLEEAELVAWTLGMAAIDMIVSADWAQATQILDHAHEIATRGPSRRRAWISALRARAHAGAGHELIARRCLDEARSALDDAGHPTHLDFFNHARLDGAYGTTHLLLKDVDAADAAITDAIARRQPDDVKGIALLMLDHAECRIISGDADGAAHRILAAATLAETQLVAPIQRRINDLRQGMSRWSDSGSVRELDSKIQVLLEPVRKV